MSGNDDIRDDGTRAAGPPAPSGPAPIIDLGGDAVPVRPVKPLGPRRLARLQRELAERARELEQTGEGPADPQLLERQRRFAELAAQAEQANADSAGVPAPEAAPPPAAPPAPVGATPAEPAPGEPATPGESEQITVVFPGADGPAGADGHVGHDPVHVDPALFGNRLAPEELAALTHIEILAPAEHHGSHAAAPEEPGATAAPQPAPHPAPPPAPPGTALPAAVPPEQAVPPEPAWAEEEPEPPAAPVPATEAGGLDLLEPREYRRGAGGRWLVLLLVLLAALAVVLVLFVL
ncbi:hypothetical protein [Kocuria sp. KH4]